MILLNLSSTNNQILTSYCLVTDQVSWPTDIYPFSTFSDSNMMIMLYVTASLYSNIDMVHREHAGDGNVVYKMVT